MNIYRRPSSGSRPARALWQAAWSRGTPALPTPKTQRVSGCLRCRVPCAARRAVKWRLRLHARRCQSNSTQQRGIRKSAIRRLTQNCPPNRISSTWRTCTSTDSSTRLTASTRASCPSSGSWNRAALRCAALLKTTMILTWRSSGQPKTKCNGS